MVAEIDTDGPFDVGNEMGKEAVQKLIQIVLMKTIATKPKTVGMKKDELKMKADQSMNLIMGSLQLNEGNIIGAFNLMEVATDSLRIFIDKEIDKCKENITGQGENMTDRGE